MSQKPNPWLILSIAALAGCPEPTSTVPTNNPPEVSIFSPTEGFEVAHGDAVTIRANVTDDQDQEAELLCTLSSQIDGDLLEMTPAATGELSDTLTIGVLSAGQHELSITCLDTGGESGSATVNITVAENRAPTVDIDAPDSGDDFTTDDDVIFQIDVFDDVDNPEELAVEIWLGEDMLSSHTPSTVGEVVATHQLPAGSHTVEVRATDTEGAVGTASVVVLVTSDHAPPECAILAPEEGYFEIGSTIEFLAMVADADVVPEELIVSWASDVDGTFASATPASDGEVRSTWSDLSLATHIISLEVIDEKDMTCTDQVTIVVGPVTDPPEVEITAPEDGGEYALGATVVFSATATDDLDPSDALEAVWESDVDGELWAGAPTSSGAVDFTSAALSGGFHVITLTVTDTAGRPASDTVTILVEVDEDGDGWFLGPDCDDSDPLINPDAEEIPYNGIDEDCSGRDADDLDGDGFSSDLVGGTDCDDTNPLYNPDATDIPYNGVDENCDGSDLLDVDGDGFSGGDGADCDDNDATSYPGATETPYDGIDQDCSGGDLRDVDGDGYEGAEVGGDDCDDASSAINPGADEIAHDGIDQDCDGADLLDADGDGSLGPSGVGEDCNDEDPASFPGADEVPYDGIDQDCDGADLTDVDGDGWDGGEAGPDCDDDDAGVYPGSEEIPYDGIDQNCTGDDLVDVDGDGDAAAEAGGMDCDDSNPLIASTAAETPYDGIDQDCDGADLVDVDGDGFVATEAGGTDCNDFLDFVNPGAVEIPYNGLDDDCNGESDDAEPTAVPELVGDAYLCSEITITGTNSFGPPGPALTFLWEYVSGPPEVPAGDVSITDPVAETTTVSVPELGYYVFSLTLSQGLFSDTEFIGISVGPRPDNNPPVADAGADFSITATSSCSVNSYGNCSSCSSCGSIAAMLDGSATADPDAGDMLDIDWQAIVGSATISDPTSLTPSVGGSPASPSCSNRVTSTTVTFQVTAEDCSGEIVTDEVTVTFTCDAS